VITYDHPLGTVHVPGPDDDLGEAYQIYRNTDEVWACDTETTGLNMYLKDFHVRIVQVGTKDKAWILRPEWHMQAIRDLTGQDGRPVWWHNWVYDGLSMEESLGLDFDSTFSGAHDTDTAFRLIDPRPVMKGGTGHKLEQLMRTYVGFDSKRDARGAILDAGKKLFGARNFTTQNMWWKIPIDCPEYLIYAGQDVFGTARIAEVALRRIKEMHLQKFFDFERPLSWRLAQMQRDGILFDDTWASQVEGEYREIANEYEHELATVWGVEKGPTAKYYANSARSLRTLFDEFGVEWKKRSEKTGDPSLDKSVIKELMNFGNKDTQGLASAIFEAKRNQHYADYIASMRSELGKDGRIHPNVRPMQAATHRMSVSNPPIQQFPRDDPRVRGCLVADPGHTIIAADYAQVEFRVGAAVSQDPVLIRKIKNGEDLHEVTATALFGPGFNKGQRQAAKPIGFGRLYMGSANGIYAQMAESDTTGYLPPIAAVKKAIAAFDSEYRGYKRWAMKLKSDVEDHAGVLYTATGRRLLVSPSYAAPNYAIQSVARDLFAAGVNKAHKMGLGQYIRLVVHDEIVASVPKRQAQKLGKQLAEAMSTTFMGVPIEVEWNDLGRRWRKG
jgi:DNA polymerase-1